VENGAVAAVDFDSEGLLDGVEGRAREARLALLRELSEAGTPLEELRSAVAEDRLALLPVEHALGGEYRYTLEEVAEEAGMPASFLRRETQALGLPVPEPGERALSESDLEAARRSQLIREAGVPDEGILEIARVVGSGMARVAAANMALIGETFIRPGDTERELGSRYAEVARRLSPELGRTMQHVFERHLRELVRQAVVSSAELESGQLPGAQEIAAGFADLVGFTKLGDRAELAEIGEITGRLTELATTTAATRPSVRLVKTIGDAAMLVSPDPAQLLAAVLDLVEAIEGDERLPQVRAGAAWGQALTRGGDWYGRPVNLASRITGAARPGSVLISAELARRADGGFRFSNAGRGRFKGIRGEVSLKRARRAG
jgi:adenylate cyclase